MTPSESLQFEKMISFSWTPPYARVHFRPSYIPNLVSHLECSIFIINILIINLNIIFRKVNVSLMLSKMFG